MPAFSPSTAVHTADKVRVRSQFDATFRHPFNDGTDTEDRSSGQKPAEAGPLEDAFLRSFAHEGEDRPQRSWKYSKVLPAML